MKPSPASKKASAPPNARKTPTPPVKCKPSSTTSPHSPSQFSFTRLHPSSRPPSGLLQSPIQNEPLSYPPQTRHFDRSAAQWRNPLLYPNPLPAAAVHFELFLPFEPFAPAEHLYLDMATPLPQTLGALRA